MAKIRIPGVLLEQIQGYTESPQEVEAAEAKLLLGILKPHFEQLEKLETETLAKLDKVKVTDGMILTAMGNIDRT